LRARYGGGFTGFGGAFSAARRSARSWSETSSPARAVASRISKTFCFKFRALVPDDCRMIRERSSYAVRRHRDAASRTRLGAALVDLRRSSLPTNRLRVLGVVIRQRPAAIHAFVCVERWSTNVRTDKVMRRRAQRDMNVIPGRLVVEIRLPTADVWLDGDRLGRDRPALFVVAARILAPRAAGYLDDRRVGSFALEVWLRLRRRLLARYHPRVTLEQHLSNSRRHPSRPSFTSLDIRSSVFISPSRSALRQAAVSLSRTRCFEGGPRRCPLRLRSCAPQREQWRSGYLLGYRFGGGSVVVMTAPPFLRNYFSFCR
jgi:hypothetical protein